jgi:hypothetical protein
LCDRNDDFQILQTGAHLTAIDDLRVAKPLDERQQDVVKDPLGATAHDQLAQLALIALPGLVERLALRAGDPG